MKIVTITEITLDFQDLETLLRGKGYVDNSLTLKKLVSTPGSKTLRFEFEKITDSKKKIPAPVIQDRETFLKTPLKDLGLSTRTFNCLNVAEIKTPQDILKCSPQDLLRLRNLGSKGVKEVKTILKKYELSLLEK